MYIYSRRAAKFLFLIQIAHCRHCQIRSSNSPDNSMTKPASTGNAASAAATAAESRYKGVRKRKWGKWVSEIRLPNSRERIWLGSYDSAEKAARAFDAALFCLRGRSARFNFPDNPPDITGGSLLSRAEIQSAAAKFANSEPRPATAEYSDIGRTADSRMDCSSPSPSPSIISEGTTVQIDSEGVDERSSFLDLHTTMGSGNYGTDFGLFPEYNSFFNELFNTTTPSFDYGDEIFDGTTQQDSFLWNF